MTVKALEIQQAKRRAGERALRSQFPELADLERGLSAVLASHAGGHGRVTVVGREPNPYRSTFPSEVITCRHADGSERRVLCKYGVPHGHTGHGYWGGTSYEAAVYRNVLDPLATTAPEYYGDYEDPLSGETWLFIEYVEGLPLNKAEPSFTVEAARWIGRLHAASEQLAPQSARYLRSYSHEYYVGWARRTALYARQLGTEVSWVAAVCERAESLLSRLASSQPVVVHGEYYPNNILVRVATVCPVDWQSAALGAGEIDLASLIEGWRPNKVERECVENYREARWPNGAPETFEKALEAARLYWPMRWLGESLELTAHRRVYFDELRGEAERLGII